MPQAGVDILASLEHAAGELRDELESLRVSREQLDSRVEELVERRTAAIEDLAQHYLPELSESAVSRTFHDVRRELHDVLKRRRRTIGVLSQQIDEGITKSTQMKNDLAQVTRQLNQAVVQRDRLHAEVAEKLEADETFRRLSEEVLTAERQLARYEQRVEESRREAEEKLPAYKASKLFQYLVDRDYATPKYRGWGLARSLDRWVAKLVDYRRARQSYDFLRSVPNRMAAEVDRHRAHLIEATNTLERMQSQLWEEVGLNYAVSEGERLGDEREHLVAQLSRIEEQSEQNHEELLSAEDAHGKYYEEAIAKFREALLGLETHVLDRRAQATPDDEDDAIVAEIRHLTEELDAAREEIYAANRRILDIESQTKGMDYVLAKFREREFDSQRSSFADKYNVEDDLQKFLAGDINQFGLWRSLKKHQSFAPTWVEKTAEKATDAINSPAGQTLIAAAGQIATAALMMAAQKKANDRGGRMRSMGGKFTDGDGF